MSTAEALLRVQPYASRGVGAGTLRAGEDAHPTESKLRTAWRLGLDYPLNEYRATWKMGGQPLAQRLRHKNHDWADRRKLIPGILNQVSGEWGEGLPHLKFTRAAELPSGPHEPHATPAEMPQSTPNPALRRPRKRSEPRF